MSSYASKLVQPRPKPVSTPQATSRSSPAPRAATSSTTTPNAVNKRYLPHLSRFVEELDLALGIHTAVFDRIQRNRR
ncbi:Hypothetical protein, putative [Bodo saltans]|uniref:Uncharacterized protein n=1 Tax=Bodo saltans TaxID=75058 RepID=A0A0S4JIH4_BODSA|nr:Hypothetical protein, putative [Bodo saltans]|eukprot:CUG90348.1 Hypothetical protein, putative [Bodo saltans]